jgi:hypothetical protein
MRTRPTAGPGCGGQTGREDGMVWGVCERLCVSGNSIHTRRLTATPGRKAGRGVGSECYSSKAEQTRERNGQGKAKEKQNRL